MDQATLDALGSAAVRLMGVGLRLFAVYAAYRMAHLASTEDGIRRGHIAGLLIIPALLALLAYDNSGTVTESDGDPLYGTVSRYQDDSGPEPTRAERLDGAAFVFGLMFIPGCAGLIVGHREYRKRRQLREAHLQHERERAAGY
jgi:hypothetical protein